MRLKADIWIKALLRRCEVQGAYAVVLHKGDPEAGTALVKVSRLDGQAAVFSPTRTLEGERGWINPLAEAFVPEEEADAYIHRERARDPDLWVIEIEDRAGRHFLDEPIL